VRHRLCPGGHGHVRVVALQWLLTDRRQAIQHFRELVEERERDRTRTVDDQKQAGD
jgi:hypothetical protein